MRVGDATQRVLRGWQEPETRPTSTLVEYNRESRAQDASRLESPFLPYGSTACRNPWYDADVEANTCSLDPSLLYGAFQACTLPGTNCAGLALGTKSSHNLVVHGAGGHQAARLSIRTQHAPAPLKRFGSVGELRKWAAAGGAAAWRRAERLQHARWQLEVDEYRVAHGLVGDAE